MNKFQNLHFRSVGEFLDYLSGEERIIVDYLREIILDSIPEVIEKLAYNVPYYYKYSRICFLWPPSVPWGNTQIKGIQLGFCNGNLLNDEIGYLEKGSRKQVYWKTFSNIREIDADLLKTYLYDATRIDAGIKRLKKA